MHGFSSYRTDLQSKHTGNIMNLFILDSFHTTAENCPKQALLQGTHRTFFGYHTVDITPCSSWQQYRLGLLISNTASTELNAVSPLLVEVLLIKSLARVS